VRERPVGHGHELELAEVGFMGNEPAALADLVNDVSYQLGSTASLGCAEEGCE